MWPLDRLRIAVEVHDRVVLAVVRERPVAEGALQDGDRLDEACLTDGGGVERQADRVVLGPVPPGADRDVEATAGQDIDRGEVLGEHGRMAQIVVEHECRDPQALGRRCDPGHRRHRTELLDQVVGNDEAVVAGLLGAAGQVLELGAADDPARVGQEVERMHRWRVRREARPGSAPWLGRMEVARRGARLSCHFDTRGRQGRVTGGFAAVEPAPCRGPEIS